MGKSGVIPSRGALRSGPRSLPPGDRGPETPRAFIGQVIRLLDHVVLPSGAGIVFLLRLCSEVLCVFATCEASSLFHLQHFRSSTTATSDRDKIASPQTQRGKMGVKPKMAPTVRFSRKVPDPNKKKSGRNKNALNKPPRVPLQSSKRGRWPRYLYRRPFVSTRIWLLLAVSLICPTEVESPSGIPIAQDACRAACESTYYDPDLGTFWPNRLSVSIWQRCPEVYGMCSLGCWSLIALKPPALLAYVEVEGRQVGGIGGTMDIDL